MNTHPNHQAVDDALYQRAQIYIDRANKVGTQPVAAGLISELLTRLRAAEDPGPQVRSRAMSRPTDAEREALGRCLMALERHHWQTNDTEDHEWDSLGLHYMHKADRFLAPTFERLCAERVDAALAEVEAETHEAAGDIETHDEYEDGLRQGYREAASILATHRTNHEEPNR